MTDREARRAAFGEALAFRRKKLGLTQRDLAHNMSVAQNTVSRWESMAHAPNDPYVIERLALYLMATPEEIRDGVLPEPAEPGGLEDQIKKIALEHADTPEDLMVLVDVLKEVLTLNPEGLRRAEDYLDLLVERFGKLDEGRGKEEDEGDPGPVRRTSG